jgi:large subunit ribosomal protein L31
VKEGIHPNYQFVVFKDGLTGTTFLSRSTMNSKDKVKHTDGKEYPLVTVEISADSHPFFTGQQQLGIGVQITVFNLLCRIAHC